MNWKINDKFNDNVTFVLETARNTQTFKNSKNIQNKKRTKKTAENSKKQAEKSQNVQKQ